MHLPWRVTHHSEAPPAFRAMERALARSIGSILADEPSVHTLPDGPESDSSPETAAPEVAKPEPVKAEAAPKGAPADKADDESPEGPEPTDLGGYGRALAAARGDKRKFKKQWQEVERQKARLEGELSVLRKQAQQPTQQAKVEQDDPDAEFYTAGPAAFTKKALESVVGDVDQRITRTKIDISEHYARQSHPDYDEKLAAFAQALETQPYLRDQMAKAPSPAEFAYQHGAMHLELSEVGGDLSAWKERERAKMKAEIEQGQPESETAPQPARTPIPPKSIAGSRGSGAGIPQVRRSPTSIGDILR